MLADSSGSCATDRELSLIHICDEINEITEEHSDYKPADARDESVKHQLTGMYQNWFLDYASYAVSYTHLDVYKRQAQH